MKSFFCIGIKSVILLILPTLFIASCDDINNNISKVTFSEQLTKNSNDEIINAFFFEPLYLEKRLDADDVVEYAEMLINNQLIVNEKIKNEVRYDISTIDWNMTVTQSPNTYSLYLHTLRPVYYLVKAYEITNNDKYLQTANLMVESWVDYDQTTTNKNRYTWYDHSVSERTENILYFAVVLRQTNPQNTNLDDLIEKHAEWLKNDKNYVSKHNHGIFEDGALIKAGYYLNNKEYINHAIDRIDSQLKYAFPNKYVHIENSFGYHMGIMSYLSNMISFLKNVQDDYVTEATNYLNGAIEFLIYAHKPNLTVPLTGDTLGLLKNEGKIKNNYGNKNLEYVQTQGKSGEMPKDLTKIFLRDGYVIFREHWNNVNFDQSTWLMFKSGFQSSTHKHPDDLSLSLYSKGHDIFIDPGMYNYMVGNNIHDFMNNATAHNIVNVANHSYTISMFNSRKTGIHSFSRLPGYQRVTGYNNIYPNVSIDRSIAYINGNHFIIIDDIQSNNINTYTQTFHLSNEVEIQQLNKADTVLSLINNEYSVLIQQLVEVDNVYSYHGFDDPDRISLVSAGLNSVIESTTIQFSKSGSSEKFITSVRIIKNDDLGHFINNKPILTNQGIHFDKFEISVDSRERVPEPEIDVKIDGNIVTLRNNAGSKSEELAYSFYLLNKDTGKKELASTSYSNINEITFELDKEKSYAVISYTRNNAMETKRKLVGFLKYIETTFIFEKVAPQEPEILNKTVAVTVENKYKFTVELGNMNQYSSKWYIYRNGASYDFISNNSNSIEYTFTEPGTYTCIYRINDIYFGEVEYGNFDQITIK
ncbi:heparinase II/III domain-containing protein [Paenibacillus chungangensis]|uniref:Heparinase II/III family protein n=1 Tax=Paenibacillus chungangensis TaxID=696535 RepID=A0ABW3HWB5_9BACL